MVRQLNYHWTIADRTRQVSDTSRDRNASAYYYNLLPTSAGHMRENDYQKATIVYAIRGSRQHLA